MRLKPWQSLLIATGIYAVIWLLGWMLLLRHDSMGLGAMVFAAALVCLSILLGIAAIIIALATRRIFSIVNILSLLCALPVHWLAVVMLWEEATSHYSPLKWSDPSTWFLFLAVLLSLLQVGVSLFIARQRPGRR